MKIVGYLKKFLPRFDAFQISAVVFFTVLNIVFLAIASQKNGFSITDSDVFFYFTVKILFDAAFLLFSILILKAVFRIAFFSALFVTANATLAISDILLYYFGNTLVERSHFALITPYSVTSFVPWYGFAAIFTFLAAIFVVSFIFIRKIPKEDLFKKSIFWLAICILLNLLNVSGVFNKKDERFDKVITGFRNAQIYYVSQNQWLDFMTDVIFPSLGDRFRILSPVTEKFVGDYRLFSYDFTVTNDLTPYEKTIKQLGLNIGENDAEPHTGGGYSRIIYIFTESLSLAALPCYNDKINGSYAGRFFCRDDIKARTFTNLTTSGTPTLQGLTVIFNSHPNYNIQEPTGHRNSLPKILKKHGYKPVFIRSASKFFANENLVFQNMGFSEIIGREDFFADEGLKKYIYGWGLEDRILYDQVVDYIKKNKNEKLFVSILGTDTHPPAGQMKYRYLDYPKPPEIRNISDKAAKLWLTSVDRMDFDIAAFIEKLDEEGLFDDSTLIVVSADHSCPLNNVTAKIPGHPRNNLAKIPLIFLSKRPLPETDFSIPASQPDIAPTIIHLAGIGKPAGWWGESLFAKEKKKITVGYDKKFLYFYDGKTTKTVNTENPADASEEALLEVFNTVFTERKP